MSKPKKQKLPASEWLPYFEEAKVLAEELEKCKSERARAIKLGQFLGPMLGREVPVQVGDRTGKAVLRVEEKKHAKAKEYFFEVAWDFEPPRCKDKVKKTKKAEAGASKNQKKQKPVAAATGGAKTGGKKAKGNGEEWD